MSTEIASLFAKIGADTSDFTRKMDGVHATMGRVNSGMNGVTNVLKRVTMAGAVLATGIGVGLVGAITKSVKSAMSMEQQLANIQAAMSLSGEETDKLKTLIQDLGLDPKLQVTATEAADAIEMLGKNGLTVDQILQGAARSTVLLANATGGDFALAADVATSAMQAFGIDASKVGGAVSHISGTLVASKFSIEDYALALSQGGGVAAAVGVSFEDFNTTIAAISPLFGSGSDAGTSFKTFLQRLIPASDDAADTMRDLGLFTGLTKDEFDKAQSALAKVQEKMAALDPTSETYAEKLAELQVKQTVLNSSLVNGSNAFFDANGKMKDMTTIAGILDTAISGLSDEQKNEALSTIFGTDAMRAAVAIAGVGEQKFAALKRTIGNTDAEEQAATRMNTLAGRMEILRGIIETIALKIGEKFMPAVEKIVKWIQEMVLKYEPQIDKFFSGLAEQVIKTIDTFIKEFPKMEATARRVFNEVKPMFEGMKDMFTNMQRAFTGDSANAPFKWMFQFIVGIGEIMKTTDTFGKLMKEFGDAVGRTWRALSTANWGDLGDAWRDMLEVGGRLLHQNALPTGADIDRKVDQMLAGIGASGGSNNTPSTPVSPNSPGEPNPAENRRKVSTGVIYSWGAFKAMHASRSLAERIALWYGSDMQALAMGGRARGGLTLVGERGPELVNMPRGANVHTASETQGALNRLGATINIENLNLSGGSNGIQNLTSTVSFLNALYG